MTPILVNLTGLVFVISAEAGIIVQSFERATNREFQFVFDMSVGYDVGFAAFNPTATYSVRGRYTGSTGISGASPGVAVTIANATTLNGVTTGGIYTQTVSISHGEKGFREISVTAIQKPGIA